MRILFFHFLRLFLMCVVRAVTVLQLGKSDPVTHIARVSLVKSHLSKFSSFARDGEWGEYWRLLLLTCKLFRNFFLS